MPLNNVVLQPPKNEMKSIMLVSAEEAIGGEEDKDVVMEEVGGSAENAKPVEVASIPKVSETSLSDWKIAQPLLCIAYTQKFHATHRGVDIKSTDECQKNRGVFAVQKGVVLFVGFNGGYGLQVKIDHGNGYVTTYSHLDNAYGVKVKQGDEVELGRQLGNMGLTGRTTGLHLHFEIIKDGIKVNPEKFL